jgi:phage repressor protein C with HTH and peptisase S24 domain
MSALPPEFGILVKVDTMAPAYRRGDTILCKTRSSLRAGRDYVIAARGDGRIAFNNEAEPTIMRIVRVEGLTDRHLFAREFNPPKIRRLSRAKWKPVARITGVYRGRPAS